MKQTILSGIIAIIVISFAGCKKAEESQPVKNGGPILPGTPYDYLTAYPAFIQAALASTDNMPADNLITNDGATLGRVLFYDKNLSINRTVSCGNCHRQANSFDDDFALSKGFEDSNTVRNSMCLLNLRFYKSGRMFWDERASTLEKQALGPITNHLEMGLTLDTLESRVRSLYYYPALFQKAFGSAVIDSVRIAKALAQFERSIVTYQSKYDRVKQGQESFTTEEARGEVVFASGPPGAPTCAGCHAPPMFITSSPVAPYAFPLEAGINGQNRFKSGSLRNVGTRKFLFHSGAIADVSTMLNAGKPGSSMAAIPAHSVPQPDIPALLAFLNTLNDHTVTVDPKFSDPFIK